MQNGDVVILVDVLVLLNGFDSVGIVLESERKSFFFEFVSVC